MASDLENHDLFMKLPEGFREKFMQQAVSRTSPEDACKLSCVSKMFRSVADSDVVWDSFILSDHVHDVDDEFFTYNSSKELFRLLTGINVYLNQDDDDSRSVYYLLDQWSGKRSLVMHHDSLTVTYLDTDYWKTQTRTSGPPYLGHVVCLEIKGLLLGSLRKKVSTNLSIWTLECQYRKLREDTLFEVELGDYFNNAGENRDLEISVREVKSGKPKCGMRIRGMELRPKRDSINVYCNSYHQTHSYAKKDVEKREGEISKEGEEGCEDTDLFSKLTEGFAQAFMEEVVSRTSPVDACRLSVMSKCFRSAAESDVAWERFLPSDYQQFICRADSHIDISFASKKDLYLFLIDTTYAAYLVHISEF